MIQGVIAMESALSRLVLKSKLSSDFAQARKKSMKPLLKAYKDAPGLPQKICKFLFPILIDKNMIELEDKLRKIMPLIRNEKTEMGARARKIDDVIYFLIFLVVRMRVIVRVQVKA